MLGRAGRSLGSRPRMCIEIVAAFDGTGTGFLFLVLMRKKRMAMCGRKRVCLKRREDPYERTVG